MYFLDYINTVHAQVLERRTREAYVHYINTDRRLDEWVPESALQPLSSVALRPTELPKAGNGRLRPIPSRMLKKERDVCGSSILGYFVDLPFLLVYIRVQQTIS